MANRPVHSHGAPTATSIAIIGMAALFPEARTLREFWQNIVDKRDCITDVPPSRWSVDDYYDPDPAAPDKTYCKRGGFLPEIDFDPLEFGLPPNILEVTDSSQLLSLVVAKQALEDAGYGAGRPFDGERTGVILGVGGGQKLVVPLSTRLQYPVWEKVLKRHGLTDEATRRIVDAIKQAYVPWDEHAFPGLLGNVIAGRIANRLDLGGINCVVDAACASSLSAVRMALSELSEGRCDLMLTGGVDADNSAFMYLCFSKTPAFSRRESLRPFDAEADGMMVGEGIGMLVLKRLADAERDGDRIYAVIRGLGAASDGRARSIYAPATRGQELAIRRAYADAGFPPGQVGLIEAHGTGTVAGDLVEATTLVRVLGPAGDRDPDRERPRPPAVALGSVKSQIGHTKAAAGAAGLIKTALALYHKVLPATINVSRPHPDYGLDGSPLYVNTETRPWIAAGGAKRRAGVSSFGFGGTNFHAVLEEHEPEHQGRYRLHAGHGVVMVSRPTPGELRSACRELAQQVAGAEAEGRHAALLAASRAPAAPREWARLGFVTRSAAETREQLQLAAETLESRGGDEHWELPRGVVYRGSGLDVAGRVVALFPGQGSQVLEMGRELAVNFPDVRAAFGAMDRLFGAQRRQPLSATVFPPPAFSPAARAAQTEALRRTDHAQPAIGALSVALYRLLRQAGLEPSFVAGHSFGELTALWAAGVLDDDDYFRLAVARGRAMAPPAEAGFDPGGMLAVRADARAVQDATRGVSGVYVANVNSGRQTVLAGETAALAAAGAALEERGFAVVPLPVSAAFHTPLVGHAQRPFAATLGEIRFSPPGLPVYSNTTGERYPDDPEAMRSVLARQLLSPVQFQRQIEAIYAAGGRIFVECGPKDVLTRLVGEILGDRPHLGVALSPRPGEDSDRQLQQAVVRLRVAGLSLGAVDAYAFDSTPDGTPDGQAPRGRRLSAATVRMNGSNYVSDATRAAFERALQDVSQLPAAAPPVVNGTTDRGANGVIQGAKDGTADRGAHGATNGTTWGATDGVIRGATDGTIRGATDGVANGAAALRLPAPAQSLDTGPSSPARLAERVERAVAQFVSHEGATLQAHEQYLKVQMEYCRAFQQITQHQQELLLGRNGAPVPVEALDGLARSMMRFHDHQSETLRVHEQYLAGQRELVRSLVDLQWRHAGLSMDAGGAPEVDSTSPPSPAAGPVLPARPATEPPRPPPLERRAMATLPPALEPAVEPAPALALALAPAPAVVLPEPAPRPAPPPAPVAPPAPAPAPRTEQADLAQELLAVVSEKTGYPVDTLELDMDVEADLGIDSIKRVEILAAMQERYPDAPHLSPADLAELRTLRQVADVLTAQEVQGAPEAPETHEAPDAPEATDRPAGVSQVRSSVVRLRSLPPPDWLEYRLPEGCSCLLTADGTAATGALAQALTERGWPVTVLSFPRSLVPEPATLPAGIEQAILPDLDETSLAETVRRLVQQRGPVGAFVHLNPPAPAGGGLFPERDLALARHVFLLAKHLKEGLEAAAQRGRGSFVAVARLDGQLGLGQGTDHGAIAGGLFGLAKTLHAEWKGVFCRAIDLAPTLAAEAVAGCVVAELHDPDGSLVEVGYGSTGRVTLAAG